MDKDNETSDICNDCIEEASIEYADKLMDNIWDDVEEREDLDIFDVIFNLFSHSIFVLLDMGWSEDELINEIKDRARWLKEEKTKEEAQNNIVKMGK